MGLWRYGHNELFQLPVWLREGGGGQDRHYHHELLPLGREQVPGEILEFDFILIACVLV